MLSLVVMVEYSWRRIIFRLSNERFIHLNKLANREA
jgi:hypothetical protein